MPPTVEGLPRGGLAPTTYRRGTRGTLVLSSPLAIGLLERPARDRASKAQSRLVVEAIVNASVQAGQRGLLREVMEALRLAGEVRGENRRHRSRKGGMVRWIRWEVGQADGQLDAGISLRRTEEPGALERRFGDAVGADPGTARWAGRAAMTPLDLARSMGLDAMVAALLSAGVKA